MKKQIALTLGAMALFGLMETTAHAKRSSFEVKPTKVNYMQALGSCGDPGMIMSKDCDQVAQAAGLSAGHREKIAKNVQCDHIAQLVGAYQNRTTTTRTRLEM